MLRIVLIVVSAILLAACSDHRSTITGPESESISSQDPTFHRGPAKVWRGDQEFRFTTIDVSGAQYVDAMGINGRGDIVGSYDDASGVTHAFLLRDGVLTTFDYPGAAFTNARGIGPRGEIVGAYRMPGEPGVNYHGYLRTPDGTFHQVDYPGHTNTIAQRILPDGTILGCRHDADFMDTMRGVVFGKDESTETDAFASMHNGATPGLRQIAGFYFNTSEGRNEGYVIDRGAFMPFTVPGSTGTWAWDVSPAGDIVGTYSDATTVHGFMRAGEEYITIDAPGAASTRAYGVNGRGDIVGAFVADGRFYGYVAHRAGAPAL